MGKDHAAEVTLAKAAIKQASKRERPTFDDKRPLIVLFRHYVQRRTKRVRNRSGHSLGRAQQSEEDRKEIVDV